MNVDEINVFFDIPNNTANILLDDILKNNYDKNKIIISDNVYTDTNIDEWIKTKPSTMGGIKLIDKLIKTPINDKKILLNRQKANYIIPKYNKIHAIFLEKCNQKIFKFNKKYLKHDIKKKFNEKNAIKKQTNRRLPSLR